MRRPLPLLILALCLLACGHYGPPQRPGPETAASEAEDSAESEETEKSE